MSTSKTNTVKQYFEAQNQGNAAGVAALCEADASVHNAAQPPVAGTDAIIGFCKNLYDRTSAREFCILKTADGDGTVMAEWSVKMTFRAGAVIGPITVERPFDVELRGINAFEFKPGSSRITCLRVYHEMTTVANLARANAKA